MTNAHEQLPGGLSLRTARRADARRLLPLMRRFNASEGIGFRAAQMGRAVRRLLENRTLGKVLLVEEIRERTAARAGAAALTLGVRPANRIARRLYARRRYKPVPLVLRNKWLE